MKSIALVIFDYSGTLSPGAVEFGRPGNLKRHLEKSGLAGIGIDTPNRYWRDVVNPTWPRASTSTRGFQAAVSRCILKMKIPDAPPRLIEAAVVRFLAAYMRHSYVDKRWQSLLADIQNRPGTLGLIATDHYAEATEAIQAHLAALNIVARPAVDANNRGGAAAFIVANSADIGCLKADRQFWLRLKKMCLPASLKKIIMVDDFGSSEQPQSSYTDPAGIANRIDQTRQALHEVFEVEPQILHYRPGENTNNSINAAIAAVRKALE